MTERTCAVDGCSRPVRVRGFCNAHYHRLRRYGDVRADVPIEKKRRGRTEVCGVTGCDETYRAKGLCGRHYMEARSSRLHQEPCVIAGCDRPRNRSTGYCARHYQRLIKYGTPDAGGPLRRLRGTGDRWAYDEARRAAKAKMAQATGETKQYVKILRHDPCVYCGKPSKHIDHIVPFSAGGATDWTNLTAACAACNYQKSTTDLLSFLLRRVSA